MESEVQLVPLGVGAGGLAKRREQEQQHNTGRGVCPLKSAPKRCFWGICVTSACRSAGGMGGNELIGPASALQGGAVPVYACACVCLCVCTGVGGYSQ